MKYHVDIYNLRPRDKGRKLAWQGTWHENAKGTAQLRSFFCQRGRAGVKLGRIGKAKIQTYVLRQRTTGGGRG